MMPGSVICGHFARPFVVHSDGYAHLSASQTALQLNSPCCCGVYIAQRQSASKRWRVCMAWVCSMAISSAGILASWR